MEIRYTKAAAKVISACNKQMQQRIKLGVEGIPKGDIVQLKGKDDIYRLRIGKYRIIFIYEQFDEKTIVSILDVGSRGDIYK